MKYLILIFLIACGTRLSRVWPVTPDVARSSSFDLKSVSATGVARYGTAWIVDHTHLLTADSRCDPYGIHTIAVSHPVYVVTIANGLCLLSSDTDLGYPLILANATPRNWHHTKQIIVADRAAIGAAVIVATHDDDTWGDPLRWRSGVIGLVIGPGKYVGLNRIRSFLTANHVDWHDEPFLPGPFNFSREFHQEGYY